MTLNDPEHAAIVARESRGQLAIGVDRVFARRFYTDVPIREIEQQAGEAAYLEKLIIFTAFIGSPVVLLAASALAVFLLHWWAALAIPAGLLSWVLYKLRSPLGHSSLTPASVLLVLLTTASVLDIGSLRPILAVGAAYILSLWLDRLVYIASTVLLRAFVIRNSKAFTWLKQHLVIRETAGAAA